MRRDEDWKEKCKVRKCYRKRQLIDISPQWSLSENEHLTTDQEVLDSSPCGFTTLTLFIE